MMIKVALVKTVTIVSRVLLEVSVGCATDEQQDLIRQALVVGTWYHLLGSIVKHCLHMSSQM